MGTSGCSLPTLAARREGTLASSPAYRRTSALTVGGALVSTAGLRAPGFRILRFCGLLPLPLCCGVVAACAAGVGAGSVVAGAPVGGDAAFCCFWAGADGRGPRLRPEPEVGVGFLAAGAAEAFLLGLPLGSAASGARATLRRPAVDDDMRQASSLDRGAACDASAAADSVQSNCGHCSSMPHLMRAGTWCRLAGRLVRCHLHRCSAVSILRAHRQDQMMTPCSSMIQAARRCVPRRKELGTGFNHSDTAYSNAALLARGGDVE